MSNYNFTSDNTSGAHPKVMQAIVDANNGTRKSYGADDATKAIEAKFSELFEHKVRAFLVATGTAANALAIAQLVKPWGSVLCHKTAHIMEDECGAPEFFSAGAKLITIEGENGKFSADTLHKKLNGAEHGAPHVSPIQAISISQATEYGTAYSLDELRALTKIAKQFNLPVHMDGARFSNVLARTNSSAAEMTWKSGVDVLSFGMTKNGALAAEAVIFFNPEQAEDFEYRRKRSGHLLSKHRLLVAQTEAMLTHNLWLENAKHANAMADYLVEKAKLKLAYPVQANEVFFHMPSALAEKLHARGHEFYKWGNNDVYRFVCSFATTTEQIDALVKDF